VNEFDRNIETVELPRPLLQSRRQFVSQVVFASVPKSQCSGCLSAGAGVGDLDHRNRLAPEWFRKSSND
jgi:hypothetical protein